MQKKSVLFVTEESQGNITGEKLSSWQYGVIFENFYHEDIGDYSTYGIRVESDCVRTFHDISTCRERVEAMVRMFNRYQLSPTHFQDIIEDMMP